MKCWGEEVRKTLGTVRGIGGEAWREEKVKSRMEPFCRISVWITAPSAISDAKGVVSAIPTMGRARLAEGG